MQQRASPTKSPLPSCLPGTEMRIRSKTGPYTRSTTTSIILTTAIPLPAGLAPVCTGLVLILRRRRRDE